MYLINMVTPDRLFLLPPRAWSTSNGGLRRLPECGVRKFC